MLCAGVLWMTSSGAASPHRDGGRCGPAAVDGATPTGPSLPWRELRTELHRFVAARVPREDADDVVQDALVRIHRGVAAVRDQQRLSAWIYQVARSAIADHLRRRRPVVALALDGEVEVPSTNPGAAIDPALDSGESRASSGHGAADDDAAFAALACCVRPFVAMLSPRYREAIAMVELDGCSQVAAAARLGVALSTLKSRVQRGRAQLRELLEACCAIELDPRRHVVGCTPRRTPGSCALRARARADQPPPASVHQDAGPSGPDGGL